jgi:hypothetical protein
MNAKGLSESAKKVTLVTFTKRLSESLMEVTFKVSVAKGLDESPMKMTSQAVIAQGLGESA